MKTIFIALYSFTALYVASYFVYSANVKNRIAAISTKMEKIDRNLDKLNSNLSIAINELNIRQNQKKQLRFIYSNKMDSLYNKVRIKNDWPIINGLEIAQYKAFSFVFIQVGNNSTGINYENLDNGYKVEMPKSDICYDLNISLKIINKRLFPSVELKDLNGNKIAKIDYNKWVDYSHQFSFYNDDKNLEIKDKDNNIVFYMKTQTFSSTPTFIIGGYFANKSSVLVMRTTFGINKEASVFCIPKSDQKWKQKAKTEIAKIKPF